MLLKIRTAILLRTVLDGVLINVGTDLPDWQKVQVTPGQVNRLKAHRDSNELFTLHL